MAIKPFQADLTPIGHFDFLDSELPNVQGGEIVVFDELPTSVADQRAPDVFDQDNRTLMRLATGLDTGPFFLAQVEDQKSFVSPGFELTSLYATTKQFGQTVDASSKVGLYGQEGFYSVNSEVVDSLSVNTNTSVGARLYPSPLGQLTATPSAAGSIVGFFVEFRDGDTLRSFGNPLNLPGTHVEGDTIIFYKTNADGYINLDFMADIVGQFGTLGAPTDGTYADGYFAFTTDTTIADAVDDLNEGMDELFLKEIGVPADGTYTDGYFAFLGTTAVANAVDDLNEATFKVFDNQLPDRANVQNITGNFTVSNLDGVVFVNATAGATTVTLDAALKGRRITIKKTDAGSNTVTVVPDGSSQIENDTNLVITSTGESITLVYDGSNWWVV